MLADGFARCTRENMAGGIAMNSDQTYSHPLHGRCGCGAQHCDCPDYQFTGIPTCTVQSLKDAGKWTEDGKRSPKAEPQRRPAPKPKPVAKPKPAKPWTWPDDRFEAFHRCGVWRGIELEVARFKKDERPRGGTQKTIQRHRKEGTEAWFNGTGPLRGCDDLPLYRERAAVAELMNGGRVYLVEGEKDVDAIWNEMQVACCSIGGAGKFRAANARTLVEAMDVDPAEGMWMGRLVVIADRDHVGRAHARDIYRKLMKAGACMSQVSFWIATPPDCKDAADVLAGGFQLGIT